MMKKILSLFLAVLFVGMLAGCNKSDKDKTNQSSQESTTQTTQGSSTTDSSTNNSSGEQQSGTVISTTIDDVRKINPEKEVSVLRRELYEAGINSSQMTDAEIEEYAKAAEEKNLDFITYIQEEVLK